MMICADLRPIEDTRTPNKGCAYEAACEISGVAYRARSRYGASYELARVLVAAGIADAPMAVRQPGLKGEMIYRSFHAAAAWMIAETAGLGPHRVRWEDPAVKAARMRSAFGQKQGSSDVPGRVAALVD